MNTTVILCTYNRRESLIQALESLAAQVVPEDWEWEVVVVDNNSTDGTRDAIEQFVRRYSQRFRYVLETQQGHSHARNAGVREARGDVLAFMDDDTVVPPDWLHSLTKSVHKGEWVGTGGRVLPKWTSPCPRWLDLESEYAAGPLVVFDLGPEGCELKQAPFGANMAFHKSMFAKYGAFRTDLGRRPDNLMGNEESEFARRLLTHGERLRYEPSALIFHPVLEDRLQKSYFLKWWFDKARSDIRAYGIHPKTKWCVKGVPLYTLRRLGRWTLAWLTSFGESNRFTKKLDVWSYLGEVAECYESYSRSKNGVDLKGRFQQPTV